MLIFMMKKSIKINDAMIKWYQYKCSEHNKLKKVFKRENSNESRPLGDYHYSFTANFVSMHNSN